MADIAATRDGTDIDFTRDALITGIEEYRQAALSRVSNEVEYTDADYGIDLVQELGTTGDGVNTIGIRASSAIMNDTRFVSATLTRSQVRQVGDVIDVALSFDVVAVDGTELSLSVLVASGEVVLVP
jgi:hypothetical protein